MQTTSCACTRQLSRKGWSARAKLTTACSHADAVNSPNTALLTQHATSLFKAAMATDLTCRS